MRNMKKGFWLLIPVVIIAGGYLLGWVIMTLWNSILVPVLHVGALGFWQALGLFVLSRILFGGFRGGQRGGPWKEKWRSMSEEERMQMKEAWKERCRPGRQYPENNGSEGIKIPVTD